MGVIHFGPTDLLDERAKNNFTNIVRLICGGYEVTAAVLVLEAWMKLAKPGETLDVTEPPSEALDRREVVVLTGECEEHSEQRLLPIIRTDAGGFFGFGEHDGPTFDSFDGRFAQMLPPKRPTAEARESARSLLAEMGIREEALRGKVDQN
jgi:hypothetical protein